MFFTLRINPGKKTAATTDNRNIIIAGAAIAILIGYTGIGWVNKVFPPAAMGAIVSIIGLELAPTAADMAGFAVGGANSPVMNPTWITVSMITLLTIILLTC